MEAQEYGNTLEDVRKATKPGMFFFVSGLVLFGVAAYLSGRTIPAGTWLRLFAICVAAGAVFPFIVLITALFGIRIHDGSIEHTFARKFIISRHRLSDIERVVL